MHRGTIFPESPFHSGDSGGLGVEGVFARRRQTVRNRPHRVAVPLANSATRVTFEGFKRRVASCRVAGVALCDIPAGFIVCRTSLCVTGANTFAS